MTVARYDYARQFEGCMDELVSDLREMLLGGRYIGTPEVARFEEAFAAYLGVPRAVGVNSGTDAILLALMALEVGPGDEVVTQANTFYATVAAVRLAGARPVLVDAEPRGFGMDADALDAAVGSRCRVLLPVHLYGKPAPMEQVARVAARHGLHVVEDAAQAHGARLHGRRVGTFGTLGCFSFHPSKNLAAAGDAGAVVGWDDGLLDQVRLRRELGQVCQNDHVVLGMNSKLDALQARVLHAKLPRLDGWNAARCRVAAQYRERLAGLPLGFQECGPGEEPVYHLFAVRCDRRDALLAHLQAAGVDAVVRYPQPIHLQPAFADMGWRPGQFPVAEALARELLCLPLHPHLDEAQVDRVVGAVRAFFGTS
ncbi:MAG TPA: DegT/DnrJ/EryC1/StrS family aminotransferase [Longimicrobiaceae bacterium]|nr:DegT/DnrJ/EryC1/StrS family aminotransferase [Longimicrobiaceae bacterium]